MLAAEPERFIKSAIAQVVGTVAKHELPGHKWPALLDFLSQTMMAENPQDKEVGTATGFGVTQRPVGYSLGLPLPLLSGKLSDRFSIRKCDCIDPGMKFMDMLRNFSYILQMTS